MRARNVLAPPETVRSPLPSTELPLIVFIFVQDTSVSCFVASPEVYVEVSTLSVLRLEKFVFITLLLADIASHDAIVVIILIF